jgi:pseudouridine synthase
VEAASVSRIHVLLASLGYGSRRELELWIKRGYIQVNGKPARLGQKVDPNRDVLKVKGRVVNTRAPQKTVVYAVHKPRGIVSTAKDPEGRKTVLDLVPKEERVFPVGRLDIMSEGLILLTNDGDLALRLTHPRYEVEKVYEVKIRGVLDEKKLKFLKIGVKVDDSKWKGAEVLSVREATKEGVKKYIVQIKVFEGKNHHVRRMFEALRCRVIRLKRIAMGPISIKGIPRGSFRRLSSRDLQKLEALHSKEL